MGTTGTLGPSTAKVRGALSRVFLGRQRPDSAPLLRCERVRDHSRRLQRGDEML